MEAFASAFDIIIVGALALPWVLLVIHLFFSTNESALENLIGWVKSQEQPALVGILLFAMAYPMGSAVSRIAQDFFDDDDLHVHLRISGQERWIRLPMETETSIRTEVYCELQVQRLAPGTLSAVDVKQSTATEAGQSASWCADTEANPNVKKDYLWSEKISLDELAERVFRFQEAAVLLQGTDDTQRPRQFHDQIMVLRGAAFNGMIAFALCLFWWSAEFRSRLRWAAPLLLSLLGFNALCNHLTERNAADPPYMEFTLLILAAAGCYLLWVRKPQAKPAPAAKDVANAKGVPRAAYLLLAVFLSFTAYLGWWATQVLYDQQIFYSYQALLQNQKAGTPSAR